LIAQKDLLLHYPSINDEYDITDYMALARGAVANDPTLTKIGGDLGATASQVALAWLMAKGHIVIPSAGSPARIAENFAAKDLVLSPDHIAAIDALNTDNRLVDTALLEKRAKLQAQIDTWHRDHRDQPHDAAAYQAFLSDIGYLLPEGDAFEIDTSNVDPEIATVAGPQLVVPSTNARFVLNAANARWGSLYDAYYGTDALGSAPVRGPFDHPIGGNAASGLADVVLESAVSAIVDMEDSVACVDAEDKVTAYRNWLGLMKGDLSETFEKGGKQITRALNPDRTYTAADGGAVTVKGRALLLVRNVGHLMTNPAILDRDGNEIYEGLMDAMMTSLMSMHDIAKTSGARNATQGSMYVVKPKMHGPEEVAFTTAIFDHVETVLGLPANTVKLGIMDEERRTANCAWVPSPTAATLHAMHYHKVDYTPMAPDYTGIAFQAACDLVFKGAEDPSGYTEPTLHKRRLELKAKQA